MLHSRFSRTSSWRKLCNVLGMATANEPNARGANENARTEERLPGDRRADIGARKAGMWAIAVGALILGIVLVALEFGGRSEREHEAPVDHRATPAPAGT